MRMRKDGWSASRPARTQAREHLTTKSSNEVDLRRPFFAASLKSLLRHAHAGAAAGLSLPRTSRRSLSPSHAARLRGVPRSAARAMHGPQRCARRPRRHAGFHLFIVVRRRKSRRRPWKEKTVFPTFRTTSSSKPTHSRVPYRGFLKAPRAARNRVQSMGRNILILFGPPGAGATLARARAAAPPRIG